MQSCKTSLRRFWTKLQNAADNDGWDLADICIAQCGDSVSKILNSPVEVLVNMKDQAVDARAASDQVEASPGLGPALVPELVPDILPFSNPDLSFDNQFDVGSWYGLGWMGGVEPALYEGFNPGLF